MTHFGGQTWSFDHSPMEFNGWDILIEIIHTPALLPVCHGISLSQMLHCGVSIWNRKYNRRKALQLYTMVVLQYSPNKERSSSMGKLWGGPGWKKFKDYYQGPKHISVEINECSSPANLLLSMRNESTRYTVFEDSNLIIVWQYLGREWRWMHTIIN